MSRSYHQIDLVDRKIIFELHTARRSAREIAVATGHHVSTTYRECGAIIFTMKIPIIAGIFLRLHISLRDDGEIEKACAPS